MDKKKIKTLVIVGPTASGKSDLAVDLALKFNGEIISADSRQVYKELNLTSGKITLEETKGVKHHLIDVCDLTENFTVIKYQSLAKKALIEIDNKNKLSIITGGTGLYISALIDNWQLPEVKPNQLLRESLIDKSNEYIFNQIKNIKPDIEIDKNNRHRLIRALEILKTLGEIPEIKKEDKYDHLFIGIKLPDDILRERINKRINTRIEMGMIKEVEELKHQGINSQRLNNLGLELKYINQYLEDKIDYNQLIKTLEYKIWQYAKRQYTWFNKDKRINWLQTKDQAINIIDPWLNHSLNH